MVDEEEEEGRPVSVFRGRLSPEDDAWKGERNVFGFSKRLRADPLMIKSRQPDSQTGQGGR